MKSQIRTSCWWKTLKMDWASGSPFRIISRTPYDLPATGVTRVG